MNDLLTLLIGWIGLLLRPRVAAQIVAVAGLILIYFSFLRPRLRRRWPGWILPADLLLLGCLQLAILLLRIFAVPVGLARSGFRAYLLWLSLDFLRLLLLKRFPADQVEQLYVRLIRPLYVVILVAGLVAQLSPLQEVAEISLFTLFDQQFTLGKLVVCLLFPYFLIVASESAVAGSARLLQAMLSLTESSMRALELILRYIVIGAGLVWLLDWIGLNGNAVAAIAGGLSIGVGFGVKELISNFISGIWLLLEGSVRPGDVLFIDGDPCQVRKLGLRATLLWRNRDNAELLVPNQEFFTTTTTTYTRTDQLRRCEFKVSAAYRHDPQTVLPLLLEAAASVPQVLAHPEPSAFLMTYGESSIDYSVRYWVADPMNSLSASSQLSQAIWRLFEEHRIEIPFPQRVLHQLPSSPSPPDQPPR